MPAAKLTKAMIETIKKPQTGQIFYRDTVLPGFGLRVGKSTMSYIIEKRTDRKLIRHTICKYGSITPDRARKRAQLLLGEITMGTNPNEQKTINITLGEVFKDYMEVRKDLRPSTIRDYMCVRNVYLPDWLDLPLVKINKNMVIKRHARLGDRSKARANMAMRVLRAIFNFAMERYEGEEGEQIIKRNPVSCLSKTRAWYEVKRRQTIIKAYELPALVKGINQLKDSAPIARGYFLFLMFTGLRREEAAGLKWKYVDFQDKTFTIIDTKNHEPLTLPMSDYLFDLLKSIKKEKINEYVFPGKSESGHMIDTRRQRDKVVESSGVVFTPHDFRRTFLTIAESLDMPVYVLKRLVNHKMKGDVTAGYIIMDVERLREPMQQITCFIMEKGKFLVNEQQLYN